MIRIKYKKDIKISPLAKDLFFKQLQFHKYQVIDKNPHSFFLTYIIII